MTFSERQKQFRQAIEGLPAISAKARIAENFGFSNSSRILQGGLFACTNNIQDYSKKIIADPTKTATQFVFMCVLTFPPHDEVYFAIVVESGARRLNQGLVKLAEEVEAKNATLVAAGKKPGSINNNVKFFITSEGKLFFDNEFTDEIDETKLDTDCLVAIDQILFAIYPPTVSARRSLLAREFVGYIGSLIGAEKTHEINVWPDESALGPGMRRMPHTIPVEDIERAVISLGGYYPGREVGRFHAALNFLAHKHFVILSGLSGTGKTQLALKYARAVHDVRTNEAPDPLLFVCPVRPEWTDPTGLTGYYDQLSNRYIVPHFLEAVLVATAHRESPVFVVLDEMNLARVEYYFSDVLSCIESGYPLQLHSSGVPLEGTTGTSIRAALPVPPNLFIIGTINIDETTNPVSDKVLDRASVIDMSAVDLAGFLADLEGRTAPALTAARGACEPKLLEVQNLLTPHGLGFGYRLAEEFVRYHVFAVEHLKTAAADVIDDLMVQKVLVKLRGSERQRPLLTSLARSLAGYPKAQAMIARLAADLDEYGSFQASR
jgi:hypothetical protein